MTPQTTPERSSMDEVIDLFKHDTDRTLLQENLKLSWEGRARKHQALLEGVLELRGMAGTAEAQAHDGR